MAIEMDWYESKAKSDADTRQVPGSPDSDSESENECKEQSINQSINHIPRRSLLPFYVNQWVDARDNQSKWFEGQIKQLRYEQPVNQPFMTADLDNVIVESVLVHFKGFSSKHDEWIDVTHNQSVNQSINQTDIRIAPLHSHTNSSELNHSLVSYPIGCSIDCLDSLDKWYRAIIIDIDNDHGQVLVHYETFDPKFDEWINVESGRIQPRGSRCAVNSSINQSKHPSSTPLYRSKKCPTASPDHEASFREELLRSLNLIVLDQGGEGNCLFRSVSHQVYGTPDHHELIRGYCMDYIEAEASFFASFVSEDVSAYVARKRQLGEWGDHVEIQAMSELYSASIEVYAYSTQPLATFHRRQSRIIRLSYHGNSHYNSLVDRNAPPPLIHELPGVVESRALSALDVSRPRDDELTRALQVSRSEFLASSSFEDAVAESLRTLAEQDARQLADASAQSEREELEQKQMELAIAEEQREFEQRELHQAVEQSMSQSLPSDHQPVQAQISASSYDEQLSHALAESAAQVDDLTDSSMPLAVQEVVELGFPLESAVAAYTMFTGAQMDHQTLIDSMIEAIIASK